MPFRIHELSRSRILLLGLLGLAVLVVLAIVTHDDLAGDRPTEPARLRLVATRPVGDVTLEGRVRDEATRRLIAARARLAFGKVLDRLDVDPAVERIGWAGRLGPTFVALAAAGPGASIDRATGTVTVAATVRNAALERRLLRSVRASIGEGVALVDRVVVRGAPPVGVTPRPRPSAPTAKAVVARTQASLDAALRSGTIAFEAGSAVITSRGLGVLGNLLPILRKAPAVRVEVAGYTDTSGVAADNLRLSQERARAVETWLVGRGIAADRLTARGYGAADPVASNDTAEGRARNRRIEMHVKGA